MAECTRNLVSGKSPAGKQYIHPSFCNAQNLIVDNLSAAFAQPSRLKRCQGWALPKQKQTARASPSRSSNQCIVPSLHRRPEVAHQRIRQLTEKNKRLQERLARADGSG